MRTYLETQDDRLLALAAGVTFYALVALFPAIAAGVSFYALFADAGTIARHLSLVAGLVPADVINMLRDEISRIGAKSDGKLTFGFLLGLGIALWSANAGMKAVFDALNIIYDEWEKRGLIKVNLVSLLFTVGAIGAVLLAVGAVVVFPLLLAALGLSTLDQPIIAYFRWPVMFVLIIVGLATSQGIQTQLSSNPARFGEMLAAAVATNFGLCGLAALLFSGLGLQLAGTIGLVSGNRNVTLAWAAASFGLPPLAEGYVAACVIPVLALPLIVKLGLALPSLVGRLFQPSASVPGERS